MTLGWYLLYWTMLSVLSVMSGVLLFDAVVYEYSKGYIFLYSCLFTFYLHMFVDSIREYVIIKRRKSIQKELDVERSFRKLGGDL